MEDFIVEKKGTEDLFYVIRLPDQLNGVVILADYVNGDFSAISMQQFVQEYAFSDLLENMDDDDEDDSEDSEEENSPQPSSGNSFITS